MDKQGRLTYEDVLAIAETVRSASHFSQFRLKFGEVEIELRRQAGPPPAAAAAASAASAPPATAAAVAAPSAAPSKASAPAARTSAAWPEGSTVVRSPMVGTFYRSPQPGAPPFVEVGREVAPETIVCIIEVMKLMNSIPAAARGVVTHILVDDASPVEYGQPLVVVRPA